MAKHVLNIIVYILTEQKYVHVKCWSHVSCAEIKDPRNVPYAQKYYLSHCQHKLVDIPVSEYFYFSKIIHPPDKCGISRI